MALDPAQQALVDKVLFRADVVTQTGQTPAFNPDTVYAEMEESARWVLRNAPRERVLFAAVDGSGTAAVATVNGRTLVVPPAAFIRFLRLEMDGWDLPVDDWLDPNTNVYRLQQNQYARATESGPLAFLVPYAAGAAKQAFEVYPKADGTVAVFEYVGAVAPESMADDLVDAMLWDTTARVLANERDFPASDLARKEAVLALGGLAGKRGEAQ